MIKKLLNGIRRKRKLKMLRENRQYWHKVNAIIIKLRQEDTDDKYLAFNTDRSDTTDYEWYLADLLLKLFEVEEETDDKLIFQVAVPKLFMPRAKVISMDGYVPKKKLHYRNKSL